MAHGIGWASGYKMGVELARIAGLENIPVRSISLHCEMQGPAVFRVDLPITVDQAEAVKAMVAEYHLAPITPEDGPLNP